QVKSNQKELLKWVIFNTSLEDAKPIDTYAHYEHNTHGRYEERVCEVYDDLYQIKKSWLSVKRVVKITATTLSYGKHTTEYHYYISSRDVDKKTLTNIIRSHWKIENSLHYVKDVSFDEDSSRVRTGQAPLISTMLRSLAINIMNINKISNIKKARKVFGWSP
ncbi:ISAs1 family transposase, partial [Proteus terrae]